VRGAAAAAHGLLRRPAAARARLRGLLCALRSVPRRTPAGVFAEGRRRARADTLLGNLTVYEMLAYTSELKNPMNEPFERKAAKVEQVLQQLGLIGCRGVRIGSQLARGISGARSGRVPAFWRCRACGRCVLRPLAPGAAARALTPCGGVPSAHVFASSDCVSGSPARAPQAASASA
jgi:hypothetical protein